MDKLIRSLTQQEQLNFLLTNRIPRRALTQCMGYFSSIESKLMTKVSIAIWRLFADDLDLSEAKKSEFDSLNDCFTRELRDGTRPIDHQQGILISPCDAIVGSCGRIQGSTVFQAKGFPYALADLITDPEMQSRYHDGVYVTLRLKSSMYHRFHAPIDCDIDQVTYISGDTWNVNPVALKRIEKLYCKNERAILELKNTGLAGNIAMVPVAAILVASMRFHCISHELDLRYKGPNIIPCQARYGKGEEMGYFQHGSTIIMLASTNYELAEGIAEGARVNMGKPLLIAHGARKNH